MKRGDVYLLSHEEYSDYGILGIVKALKEFNFDTAISEYKALCERDEENGNYHPNSHEEFVDKLIADGLCELVHIPELHLGCYSRFCETPELDMMRHAAERAETEKGGS